MLVLRNALVSDADDELLPDPGQSPSISGHVIPNFYEGAISFYVKPRTTPWIASGATMSQQESAQTLFYTHFVIKDNEAREVALATNYDGANEHQWYHASIRLLWGGNHNENNAYVVKDEPLQWPYIITPFQPPSSFSGQAGIDPNYFLTMTGHTIDGETGYLMSSQARIVTLGLDIFADLDEGDVPPLDNEELWAADNMYAEEKLILEFIVTKYAYQDVTDTNSVLLKQEFDENYWQWEMADDVSPLAKATAYDNSASTPLGIFDTSFDENIDHHTIRKLFVIGHPFNLQPDPAVLGTGPRDKFGNHQALVSPGRWNHIFLTWRNLYDLLNNTQNGHRGGSLAVYINGSFKKTVNDFEIAGLFFQQDYFMWYNTIAPWSELWVEEGFTGHQEYEQLPEMKHQTWTIPNFSDFIDSQDATFFAINKSYYGLAEPYGLPDFSYSRGRTQDYDIRKKKLFFEIPSRLFFGFEPHTYENIYNGGSVEFAEIPFFGQNFFWGSMMDIQVFDRAHDDLLMGDGGFVPELPNYDEFSPYAPVAASATLYPLYNALKAKKILALSALVHVPEFHNFWDDQNETIAGPDGDDSQLVEIDVIHEGSVDKTLKVGQDPAIMRDMVWQPLKPLSIKNVTDLELEMRFSGAPITWSTPLVEELELTFLKDIHYSSFKWAY